MDIEGKIMRYFKIKKVADNEYGYIDSDGVSWNSLSDYVETEVLGFCGCGAPELAAEYVRDALHLIKEYSVDLGEYDKFRDVIYEEDEYYFLQYMLDNIGLTEHGGSVNYPWLTDKGELVLEFLQEYLDEEVQ